MTEIKKEEKKEVKEVKEEIKEETPEEIKKEKKPKKKDIIKSLEEELLKEKEKALRAQAEMLNFKKRKDEEVNTIRKYASEDLIKSLLPVIDNFERAIKLDDNDLTDELSKFLSGFKLIYGELTNILINNDVTEIPASGLEFDPTVHQAVITEKDKSKPGGVILEVLQKGYKYKERVIRPAMVKVNE